MQNLTILVVDDEDDVRDMLEMVLENANMIAITVSTAEQAMKILMDVNVDLLLLDWMLPGISGIELARQLKNNVKYSALPIILLTARTENEDRIRAFQVGVNDYITKPFSPKDLIVKINSIAPCAKKRNIAGSVLTDNAGKQYLK